jgi:hypothetical protein
LGNENEEDQEKQLSIKDLTNIDLNKIPLLSNEAKLVEEFNDINEKICFISDSETIETITSAFQELEMKADQFSNIENEFLENYFDKLTSQISNTVGILMREMRNNNEHAAKWEKLSESIDELKSQEMNDEVEARKQKKSIQLDSLNEIKPDIGKNFKLSVEIEIIRADDLFKNWLMDLLDGFKSSVGRQAQAWTVAYSLKIKICCYDENIKIFEYGTSYQLVNLQYSDLKQDTSLISLVRSELNKDITEDFMICKIFQAYKYNKKDFYDILQRCEDQKDSE